MFSGIIEDLGKVKKISPDDQKMFLKWVFDTHCASTSLAFGARNVQ